jgi:hypothetical protein
MNPRTMRPAMTSTESNISESDAQEWARRKAANKRLGWIIGLIVLMIFLGTLWKYRPL